MNKIFFDSWESIFRTFIITVLAYVILIIMLRVSGKRTLSKMNSFDFIVTIALGSTLATVLLNKSVALADGALALFLLIMLQYVITWLSYRSATVKNLVKATPALLAYKGELLEQAMKKERVTKEEVFAKAREKGFSSLKDIDVVVLETDGSLTVLGSIDHEDPSAIQHVKNFEEARK